MRPLLLAVPLLLPIRDDIPDFQLPGKTPSMSFPIRRLLIDVTHTAMGDTNHGIQRVTRNIAKEALAYSETHSLPCIPVIHRDGQFVLVDEACITRGFRRTHPDQLHWNTKIARSILPNCSIGIEQAFQRARKLLYPRTLVRKLSRIFAGRQNPPIAANPGPGDILLLPDAWWCVPMFDALAAARRNHAIVGTMIQDLIPIRNPELCDDRFVADFRPWITKAIQSVDFILGNSQTTREDLWSFVQAEKSPLANWQVRHVRLGCDIESHENVDEQQLAPKIRNHYGDRDAAPYLMVSTVEIRKNHKLLLDAFEELWRQGSDASVAFVGRVGWKCKDLIRRIKNHPQYGRRLLLFTDIDDAELAYIYQNSKAFLFPSLAEGFGLPIAEALHHGLHVFASNLAIHQEVGGPHCKYFTPHEPCELVEQLQQFEATKGWRTPIQAPTVNHPWSTTFENIIDECQTIATKIDQTRPFASSMVA